MSWNRYRRRHEVIHSVLRGVARSGRISAVEETDIRSEFGDLAGFLLALHQRWYTAFGARVDAVLESYGQSGPGGLQDLRSAVVAAWDGLAAERPELRALLDAHADHPALAEPVAAQASMLRWATGLDLADVSGSRRRDTVYAGQAARAGHAAHAAVPEPVG
ncbi:MAG: hypothetical protein ACRDPK_19600 [Carbonactinosporaceae bacterium]